LVLTNSTSSGKSVRININRQYLARAVRFGLNDLCLFGNNSALLGHDEHRTYVWMPLDGESAIKPASNAVRIESPKGESAPPVSQPSKPRRTPSVPEATTNTNSKAASNGQTAANGQPKVETVKRKSSRRKTGQQDITALIDQAIKFRTSLHNLMHDAGEWAKSLKQHRRQSRAIQSALTSISQVKTLL
jgi:hypothetical protein